MFENYRKSIILQHFYIFNQNGKNSQFGEFSKIEAYGETVLPDETFLWVFKQCVEGVNHTLVFQRILTPLPIPFTSFDYFFCNHFPAKNGLGNMKWPAAQLVY